MKKITAQQIKDFIDFCERVGVEPKEGHVDKLKLELHSRKRQVKKKSIEKELDFIHEQVRGRDD